MCTGVHGAAPLPMRTPEDCSIRPALASQREVWFQGSVQALLTRVLAALPGEHLTQLFLVEPLPMSGKAPAHTAGVKET